MVRTVTDDDIGLKVLYEAPSDAPDTIPASFVDIVAIHGIGAHPDDTWCKKVNADGSEAYYVHWLKDEHMLPAVVPKTRIMRYGYQSQWFGDEAISQKASTVAQRLLLSLKRARKACPHRPLIFIAHCFGGLVVLRAVVDAQRSEGKWPGIFRSTTGMMFFGTPFRGAGGLSQSEMVRAAQSQYEEGQVQGAVLNILAPGNEALMDLMTLFFETRQETNITHIACFFEQKSSNVGAILRGTRIQKFVVDESSGCLDQSEWTEKYSLSRDHFSMNKFGKPEEEDFQTVCEVMEKMVEISPGLVAERDQGGGHFRVQFHLTGLPVSGNFVDRDIEMREIEGSLLPLDTRDGRKIHILHGLGGIGKTQLVIAYCRKHQGTHSAILWLNGNSQDTLSQSLAAFATYARIDGLQGSTIGATGHGQEIAEKANAVRRWLALKGNHQWLIVLDNVDRDYYAEVEDPQAYNIESFLPAADQGSILITTRLPHLGVLGTATKVKRVGSEQALRILMNNARLPLSTPDTGRLLEKLGGLPLALVQAGRYMHETGTSCPQYLRLYNTSWSELQADGPRLHDYANGSIRTTWSISYERVKQSDPTAAKLVQLWAYLDHQDLWFELLKRGSRGSKDVDWFQDLVRSEISFNRVIKMLLAYSLVESHQGTESYSIHPVVHDWCMESISNDDLELMMLALTVVGFAVPSQSEPEYWVIQQRLLPHANRCVQQLSAINVLDAFRDQDSDDAFHNLGDLYADQGKMTEAEKMYRRALDGYEKAWGPEHTSTLHTVNNLGLLYTHQGKPAEAEKMYRRALDGYEKAWGPEHTSTLDTVNNLGLLYKDQGKLAEAEKMYRRALDGYEKAWGPEHTSTLRTVNNLGLLYKDQGKLAEAEKMYRRALDGKEKAWGPEHTSTLDTVNNLGSLYKHQGKLAEAEKMYRRALDGKEKAWGPEHTSSLDTVNNLGSLYTNQGKLAEAEKMYRRALDGYEKLRGPNHPTTKLIGRNLSINLVYKDWINDIT